MPIGDERVGGLVSVARDGHPEARSRSDLNIADVVSKLETKTLEDLLKKSERTKEAMPPVPDLAQLNGAQEQTERNSRDLAKTAEDLPGGAEPSALLTKAAGKMERAIVFLRDNDLSRRVTKRARIGTATIGFQRNCLPNVSSHGPEKPALIE